MIQLLQFGLTLPNCVVFLYTVATGIISKKCVSAGLLHGLVDIGLGYTGKTLEEVVAGKTDLGLLDGCNHQGPVRWQC